MEGWIFIWPHSYLTDRHPMGSYGSLWCNCISLIPSSVQPITKRDQHWVLNMAPLFQEITNNLVESWLYWKGLWFILTGMNIYLEYRYAFPILRASVSTTIWRHVDGVLDPQTQNPVIFWLNPGTHFREEAPCMTHDLGIHSFYFIPHYTEVVNLTATNGLLKVQLTPLWRWCLQDGVISSRCSINHKSTTIILICDHVLNRYNTWLWNPREGNRRGLASAYHSQWLIVAFTFPVPATLGLCLEALVIDWVIFAQFLW